MYCKPFWTLQIRCRRLRQRLHSSHTSRKIIRCNCLFCCKTKISRALSHHFLRFYTKTFNKSILQLPVLNKMTPGNKLNNQKITALVETKRDVIVVHDLQNIIPTMHYSRNFDVGSKDGLRRCLGIRNDVDEMQTFVFTTDTYREVPMVGCSPMVQVFLPYHGYSIAYFYCCMLWRCTAIDPTAWPRE